MDMDKLYELLVERSDDLKPEAEKLYREICEAIISAAPAHHALSEAVVNSLTPAQTKEIFLSALE